MVKSLSSRNNVTRAFCFQTPVLHISLLFRLWASNVEQASNLLVWVLLLSLADQIFHLLPGDRPQVGKTRSSAVFRSVRALFFQSQKAQVFSFKRLKTLLKVLVGNLQPPTHPQQTTVPPQPPPSLLRTTEASRHMQHTTVAPREEIGHGRRTTGDQKHSFWGTWHRPKSVKKQRLLGSTYS